MFINSLILALSSSIDSLGIGITYGIKNTRISYMAKIVLFVISFLISFLSVCFGDILKNIFSVCYKINWKYHFNCYGNFCMFSSYT